MFINARFPTTNGPALISEPTLRTIPRDPVAAAVFAIRADRAADALSAGRFVPAEKLSHAPFEARCRAEGARE